MSNATTNPPKGAQPSLSTFATAAPSLSMSSSLKAPSSRPRRVLSTERMCSVRAFVSNPIDGSAITKGSCSGCGVWVSGTITTVPQSGDVEGQEA